MHQYFLGIDVSKGQHTAALIDEAGRVQFENLSLSDDAAGYACLLAALRLAPECEGVHVCLEATGNYGDRVAAFLAAQPGFVVSRINARQSHHFAKVLMLRAKTDRVDALLLARYARALTPAPLEPGGDPQLAALTRSRQTLLESLTAQTNLLRSLLERVNPALERHFRDIACQSALTLLSRYPTGEMLQRARGETLAQLVVGGRRFGPRRARRLWEASRTIPGEQGTSSDALVVRQLVATIRQLQQSLAALEAEIHTQVQDHLLMSVEGLSDQTVAVVLAELPVARLEDDAQAMAFAGMNPTVRRSGRFVGKVKLSKCGPPQLRRALYMGVLAALRRNQVLRRYYERKLAEGKKPKAALIACMSKLLRIIFGVLKRGRAFDPNYEHNRRQRRAELAAQNA